MNANRTATETARALGLTRGIKLWMRDTPKLLRDAIDPEGCDIELLASPSAGMDVALIVVDGEAKLDRELQALSGLIQPAGHVWVLWEGDAVSSESVSDAARADGFLPGATHRIADRWTGLKLDPAPSR